MSFIFTPLLTTTGTSSFREALLFFERLGIYDVILPFLLVFTMVFAIFERTKVLGTQKVEGVEYAKKNLNSMVAFVIAFLVVASAQMVAIINSALPNVVLLLFMAVFFLLLIGIFYSEKEEVVLGDKGKMFFIIVMFIAILCIFLYAIPTSSGEPFLTWMMNFVLYNYSSAAVSSIILMVIVIGFLFYIIREPAKAKSE